MIFLQKFKITFIKNFNFNKFYYKRCINGYVHYTHSIYILFLQIEYNTRGVISITSTGDKKYRDSRQYLFLK